jgi:PAP2 superfamily
MKQCSGKFRLWYLFFLLPQLLVAPVVHAQTIPTCAYKDSIAVYPPGCYQKLDAGKFIVPGVMIAYGFAARHTDVLLDLSESMQEEIWDDHPHNTTTIDNYLQYAPAAAVYALNLAGIKGEHNYLDGTMIFLISNLIMEGFVSSIKVISHEQRPNGQGYESFPSGHTAEAFLGATFLFEEYKNVSPWYGVGGYLVAGTVGYLRIYNNKHWFNDVVAGAGFGIASTEFTYWLYPLLKRTFFPKSCGKKMIVPVMEDHGLGLAFVQIF